MAFIKHRHDMMHRGQVPADQLAEGTPEPGDVPSYQYDGSVAWEPQTGEGGGGAPTDADYLVGTAHAGLSGEIVVGTTPGGELGGTWASPTVDATHSGSSHAGIQAAAEATAAAALGDHTGDASDAHDASAISVLDTAANFTGTDVEAALAELAAGIAAATTTDLKSLSVDLSVSGSVTLDRDTAASFDLTLTGNTVITPDATTTEADETLDMRLLIRQDGTGGRTLGWVGVTWVGGTAPTMPTAANAMLTVALLSPDEGVTWLGYYDQEGEVLAPASTVEDETTWGITPAVGTDAEYARQDHTHGTPADPAAGAVGPLLISDDHSTPIVFADLLLTEEEDDLLYADVGG